MSLARLSSTCVTLSNLFFHTRSIDRVFKPHHPNFHDFDRSTSGQHSYSRKGRKVEGMSAFRSREGLRPQARQVVTWFSFLVYLYRVRGTFVYLTTYEIPAGVWQPNFKDNWLKHGHTNVLPCHPIRRRIPSLLERQLYNKSSATHLQIRTVREQVVN